MTDTTYLIPVMETLETAWKKVSGSKGPIWCALLLVFVIMFGLGIVSSFLSTAAPAIEPAINILIQIFGFLLNMGLLYMGIRRAQDAPISYGLVFRSLEGWLSFKIIGLYILQILIFIIPMIVIATGVFIYPVLHTPIGIGLGILICVIGVILAVFLAVRMMISMAFVLDKGAGPVEALQLSFRATRSNIWRLIGIFLLQYLIILISIIPLGIGLIWTIPFTFIVYGAVYNRLSTPLLLLQKRA